MVKGETFTITHSLLIAEAVGNSTFVNRGGFIPAPDHAFRN